MVLLPLGEGRGEEDSDQTHRCQSHSLRVNKTRFKCSLSPNRSRGYNATIWALSNWINIARKGTGMKVNDFATGKSVDISKPGVKGKQE